LAQDLTNDTKQIDDSSSIGKEESHLSSSLAFKEYARGPNKKVSPPWATIIITGVLVGLAYVGTEIFASLVYDNPYALNFILALYGIPAGFFCGLKNKNLSLLTSLQYSTLSALFSVITFGIISACWFCSITYCFSNYIAIFYVRYVCFRSIFGNPYTRSKGRTRVLVVRVYPQYFFLSDRIKNNVI